MPAASWTPLFDHARAYFAATLPSSPRPVSARPGPARHASGIVVGQSPLRVWGLPSALRLERQLALAGALADEAAATRRVLLRADWVYDDALVRGLVAAESDLALHAVDGIAVARQCRRRRCRRRGGAARGRPRPGLGPGSERRGPGRRLQQRPAQARAALPDPAQRRHLAGDRAARLRQLVQGRHRPGDALRLAASGALGDAPVRPRRHHAEPGHDAQPGAGARGDGAVLDRPLRARTGGRLGHDLPRHRRRQAGARHAALLALRQCLRSLDRPDPSAVLVVGLDRRPAGGGLHARARLAGACRHRRRLCPAAHRGRRLHRLLRHRDAHLAALRQPLPPDHGTAQSQPAAAHRVGAARPAGPRHRRGRDLDRRLAR